MPVIAVIEDFLIRAVIANPDDDGPRLIYADWLDENGQQERADFIRIQCMGTRLAPGDERARLLRRSRALLKKYGWQWAGPLSQWIRWGTFRRGFLEEVTLPPGVYLDHATEIGLL